ncbi:MAG: ATP-binding protein [Chlorobiales bacterium]|nr:ATP-binding protein [Chlorobiales bacterium]
MNTSYAHQFFGKDIHELTSSDIEQFFSTEQDETDLIEFKCGELEVDDLFKSISAFLNTEGGLLIYGAPKPEKSTANDKRKVCKGKPIPTTKVKTKEQLNQRITSNISPLPVGIKIQSIDFEKGMIFVLDVPQSPYAPHQNLQDGRYYIRLEAISKHAPHGIVESLFNRRQKPLLKADIFYEKIDDFHDRISVEIINESKITAENVSYIFTASGIYNVKIGGDEQIEPNNGEFVYNAIGTNNALVKGLNILDNYTVQHKKENYLIKISYWCKDGDLNKVIIIWNPKKSEIVKYFDSRNEDELSENEFYSLIPAYDPVLDGDLNERKINPFDAEDCKEFIQKNKDKIIRGIYNIVTDSKWIGDLDEDITGFLVKYCKDSKNTIAERTSYSKIIQILAQDKSSSIREGVAKNPNTQKHILSQLTNDSNLSVRKAVAVHPNTAEEDLEILARNNDKFVRDSVFKNPKTPDRLREKIKPTINLLFLR